MRDIARFGNFGVRERTSLKGDEYYEVVKYYDNPFYMKYNDYVFDERRNVFHPKDDMHVSVPPESFIHKESSITLCFIDKNQGGEPDFKSVGLRPVNEVPSEEYEDFKQACQKAYNEYMDWYKNNNEN